MLKKNVTINEKINKMEYNDKTTELITINDGVYFFFFCCWENSNTYNTLHNQSTTIKRT